MATLLLFHYILFLLCLCKYGSGEVLCTEEICNTQRRECASPAPHCSINNATHSGIWLPSPTMCNCCEFCLPTIAEGQPCSLGGPGTGNIIGRCADGLTCMREDDGNHCRRMNTTCHAAQDDYDARHANGQVGSLEERPSCDGRGLFDVFSCAPTQTCFCQSEDGSRLFGEVLHIGSAVQRNMRCGCSRFHEKIRRNISPGVQYPVIGPRCTSDGSFNPIQCIDRDCYCVNRDTGTIIDGPRRMINLDEEPLTELICYDPQYDLFPQQSVGVPPFNYTTPCLENILARIELMMESEELGFDVSYASGIPQCLPDGTFGRIAETRNQSKICVNENGRQIADYEAFSGTPEYDSMDCKCAQTTALMNTMPEKPVCCRNGNFRPIQCRRGLCRCVDRDGKQVGRENSMVNMLPCFTQNWRSC